MKHIWHWYCGVVTTVIAAQLSINEEHLNWYSVLVLVIGIVINEIIYHFMKEGGSTDEPRDN